jgi:hypothetical protein
LINARHTRPAFVATWFRQPRRLLKDAAPVFSNTGRQPSRPIAGQRADQPCYARERTGTRIAAKSHHEQQQTGLSITSLARVKSANKQNPARKRFEGM